MSTQNIARVYSRNSSVSYDIRCLIGNITLRNCELDSSLMQLISNCNENLIVFNYTNTVWFLVIRSVIYKTHQSIENNCIIPFTSSI